MPFFSDLCSGIVGNLRNCTTTPITRKKLLVISGIVLSIILLIVIIAVSLPSAEILKPDPKGRDAIDNMPLVEGNSDFKDYVTKNLTVSGYDYKKHFEETIMGAQVIATSVSCEAQFKDVVAQTIDQLDFLKRLVDASKVLKIVYKSQEIRTNKINNYHSVVLAIGGGHSIDSRLSILRSYINQGVRIISLASPDCSNPWAKSIGGVKNNSVAWNGTNFLKAVVVEINRLGVAIDLAGSDKATQAAVLIDTKAPVIYRGVGFNSLVQNDINLDNDDIEKMKTSGGLVMLSLDCNLFAKSADCSKKDFMAFLNEAKSKLGVSNIGIGGLVYPNGKMPKDLKYSDFPSLFDDLKNDGWTISELEHLAGLNFMNFLQKIEEAAKRMSGYQPKEDRVAFEVSNITGCYSKPIYDSLPISSPK